MQEQQGRNLLGKRRAGESRDKWSLISRKKQKWMRVLQVGDLYFNLVTCDNHGSLGGMRQNLNVACAVSRNLAYAIWSLEWSIVGLCGLVDGAPHILILLRIFRKSKQQRIITARKTFMRHFHCIKSSGFSSFGNFADTSICEILLTRKSDNCYGTWILHHRSLYHTSTLGQLSRLPFLSYFMVRQILVYILWRML